MQSPTTSRMYKSQCLLAFVALYVRLAHSWEFAVSVEDRLEFYVNDTKTDAVRLAYQNPSALAYDELRDTLLYVDKQNGNDAICEYYVSFSKYKCNMKRSGRDIHGLAFDPITNKVFFTDTKERSINWFLVKAESNNNDTGNLLIKLREGIPTSIAVDSCRGYIYWINTNVSTSTIERARFDGSSREIVINARYQKDLHSLAIDQQTNKMYWMMPKNTSTAFLYSAKMNGDDKSSRRTFTSGSGNLFTHPNAITVSKKNLFVVYWCKTCSSQNVFKYETLTISSKSYKYRHLINDGGEVGIVAKYNIAEQFEGVRECQHLSRLIPQHSLKIATEYQAGAFCVHGQSLCKCTPGYTGELCNVSVCDNYCIHGTCSINNGGFPECRCLSGYSGAKCEKYFL